MVPREVMAVQHHGGEREVQIVTPPRRKGRLDLFQDQEGAV